MAKILINKSHLFHNLEEIEKRVGNKDNIMVVLKDNAYGHGLKKIARLCAQFGIKNAVVRSLKEAEKIKKYFNQILVLADTKLANYSQAIHITVNSLEEIENIPKNTKIQLKVDTGMHRNGLLEDELESAILRAVQRNLIITGVFTHYKNADEIGTQFFWQKQNFKRVKKEIKKICEKLFLPIPVFHSFNSSALFRENPEKDELVRVGLALYGYVENDQIFGKANLKPVASLYTNKISSRKVHKNSLIGYGGRGVAKEDMIISNYDIGYGDGFLRLNENKKYKTPKGYEILGRVSMGNLSLNCSDDEVCLFENARELAKIHGTIVYEILTSLKPSIKRVIV